MANHYLYLDTETTGLDVSRHDVWEMAYAMDDGPISSSIITHTLVKADAKALEVGNYWHRMMEPFSAYESAVWEDIAKSEMFDHKSTLYLVGANPGFDARFLEARWGLTPWHYRMIDIESFAMGAIGHLVVDGINVPVGLHIICETLRTLGWDIPAPDHSASGDVAALRAAFKALTAIYVGDTP